MSFIFTTNSTITSPRREKVSDWAGTKKSKIIHKAKPEQTQQEDDWKDVHTNIKQMDQFYDATFYAWLKSEENVLVTSIYLHRIANEYSLDRIINALEWLTNDWRWESTSILVRHMTVDWCDDEGDIKRATLLRQLTHQWATHYIATLVSTILMSSPYNSSCPVEKRERFLREFTQDWDFSKLSEFFMFLRSRANIDYKFKCIMLQEAARRDVLVNLSNSNKSDTAAVQHHRRTSSNDFQDMKRSILEDTNSEEPFSRCYPNSFSAANNSNSSSSSSSTNNTSINPTVNTISNTTSSSSSTTTSRYHHHTRLNTSSSTLTMTVASSSTTNNTTPALSPDSLIPSPSSSTSNNNNNNDKKRITVI